MASAAARVLWTKQLTKKKKTWNDGYVLISPSRQATLFNEDGKELSTCSSLPQHISDVAAAEEIKCFEGYLVQGDSECEVAEVSNLRAGLAGRPAPERPVQTTAVMQRAPLKHQQQPATHGPMQPCLRRRKSAGCSSAAAVGGAGAAGTTACCASSATPASAGDAAGPPPNIHLTTLQRQRQWQQQPPPPQQQQQQQGLSSQFVCQGHPGAALLAAPRTDTEILQLLDSLTPAGSTATNNPVHDMQQQRPQGLIPQLARTKQQHRLQQQHQPQHQPQHEHQHKHHQHQQPAFAAGSSGNSVQLPHHGHLEHNRPVDQQLLASGRSSSDSLQVLSHTPAWQQVAGEQVAKEWAHTDMHADTDADLLSGMQEQQHLPPSVAVAATAAGLRSKWQAPSSSRGCNGSSSSSSSFLHGVRQPLQPLQANSKPPLKHKQQQPQGSVMAADKVASFKVASTAGGGLGTAMIATAPGHMGAACKQLALPARPSLHGAALYARQLQQQGQIYTFPAADAAVLQRHMVIPTSFAGAAEYQAALLAAMVEESNLQLAEHAKTFHGLVQQVASATAAGKAVAHTSTSALPLSSSSSSSAAAVKGKFGSSSSSSCQGSQQVLQQLQALCNRTGLQYHPDSTLTVYNNNNSYNNKKSSFSRGGKGRGGSRGRGRKGKQGGCDAEDDEEDEQQQQEEEMEQQQQRKELSIYLRLPGKLDRRKFRRHDVWVLSSHPTLSKAAAAGFGSSSSGSSTARPFDRTAQHWAVLVRSNWHGPDRDGKMEVELLPGQQQLLPPGHRWQRQQQLAALQAPDLATELQVADFISSSSSLTGWSLLPHLIHPVAAPPAAAVPAASAMQATTAVTSGTAAEAAATTAAASAALKDLAQADTTAAADAAVEALYKELLADEQLPGADAATAAAPAAAAGGNDVAAETEQQGLDKLRAAGVKEDGSFADYSNDDDDVECLQLDGPDAAANSQGDEGEGLLEEEGWDEGSFAAGRATGSTGNNIKHGMKQTGLKAQRNTGRRGVSRRRKAETAAAAAAVCSSSSSSDGGWNSTNSSSSTSDSEGCAAMVAPDGAASCAAAAAAAGSKRQRVMYGGCSNKGSSSSDDEGGFIPCRPAAAAAAAADPSPPKRARLSSRRQSKAAAAAARDDDSDGDVHDGGGGGGDQDAGVQAAPEAAAAVPQEAALAAVVQRFRLNPAQARVAAHCASWLPLLSKLDRQQQQQQQQHKGRKLAAAAAGSDAASSRSSGRQAAGDAIGNTSNSSSGVGIGSSGIASSGSSAAPPVCLIHGPFGSGKSSLLVSLCYLLTGAALDQTIAAGPNQQQQQQTPCPAAAAGTAAAAAAAAAANAAAATSSRSIKRSRAGQLQRSSSAALKPHYPRILVAAHTNVAVDRVLLALLDSGFTNILRVGSLPRVSRRLLGSCLHAADDAVSQRDVLIQLQQMAQEATGGEAAMIRAEIAAVQAGAERQRRRRLATAAVVGVTCCSALQATLEGHSFDIVLLDEASQMTEPTSLVPLFRARPRFVILAGDPCQLPPVLASPAQVTPLLPPPAAAAAALAADVGRTPRGSIQSLQQQQQQQRQEQHGLLRTLFVRLSHLGHVPHLLTHQYRCHPALSALSNRHFYNSCLVDGVTAEQRPPLVEGLPPLLLCDCQAGRSQLAEGGSRSSVNKPEARLIVQLVLALLQCTSHQQQQRQRQQQQHTGSQGEDEETDQQETDRSHQGSDDGADAGCGGAVLAAHQLGVICFFRGQAKLIKQMLAAEGRAVPGAADVQVATVDAFQGAERDVVLLATTTTNPRSEFCSDSCRLNVALTRARHHLVVVGMADVLAQAPSAVLRDLVKSCRAADNGCLPGTSILCLPALAKARRAQQLQQQQLQH